MALRERRFHWEFEAEPLDVGAFRIEGGVPLSGTVRVSGAKNAALKLMAAATLTGERCRLDNVPEIEDVRVMADTLRDLGVVVDHVAPNRYEIASGDVEWLFIPLEAAAKMRASFVLLGPLLSRFGRVIISNPGGDRIGRRPVNLHVDAMRALGARIEYRNGYFFAQAPGRLRGGEIVFPNVTVMGTENALLAAVLAEGTTTIRPAAAEPEVDDLIAFLTRMGARIARPRPDVIEVQGVRRLRGADHTVVADRIEAGTFITAAAVTGGEVTVDAAPSGHLGALLDLLGAVGVDLDVQDERVVVDGRGVREGRYRAASFETAPYPGFPTDLQAPAAVLLTQASGESRIHETIFEDRLEYTAQLVRMGARIDVPDPHHCRIHGPTPLRGAELEVPDLRAGASLILAALSAEGRSHIAGAIHVERGYENIETKFLELGARVERVSARTAAAQAV